MQVLEGDKPNQRFTEQKFLWNNETKRVVSVSDSFVLNQCMGEQIEYYTPATGMRRTEPVYREATEEEIAAHKAESAKAIAERNRQCAEDRIRNAAIVINAADLTKTDAEAVPTKRGK